MSATAAQKSLQSARILHLALLAAAIAYIFLPFSFAGGSAQRLEPAIPVAVGIVALANLGMAVYFRQKMITPAEDILRNNPEDIPAALKWRGGVLVSLVLCESIALFGMTLRFLGVPWSICGIFYAVGIFFIVAWWPRLELPPD